MTSGVSAEDLDDLCARLLEVQYVGMLMDEAEQQMLGADIPMPQARGLLAGEIGNKAEIRTCRAEPRHVDTKAAQRHDGHPVIQPSQTLHEVTGSNTVMAPRPGYLRSRLSTFRARAVRRLSSGR